MDRTADFHRFISLSNPPLKSPSHADQTRSALLLRRDYTDFLQQANDIRLALQQCAVDISTIESLDASSSSFENVDAQISQRIPEINNTLQALSRRMQSLSLFKNSSPTFNTSFVVCELSFLALVL